MPRSATIYCPRRVRDLWPDPLASQWMHQYPDLFDLDDLRLTRKQPRNHFSEWYCAIHVYRVHGALSLIEKYTATRAHPRKRHLLQLVMNPRQIAVLRDIMSEFRVNPPDLLAYTAGFSRFWFVEVKGPGDRLMKKQVRSHAALRSRLKVPVRVIEVRVEDGAGP